MQSYRDDELVTASENKIRNYFNDHPTKRVDWGNVYCTVEWNDEYMLSFTTSPAGLHEICKGPVRVQQVQDQTYTYTNTLLDLIKHRELILSSHASNMEPFALNPLLFDQYHLARHVFLRWFAASWHRLI